MTNPEGQIAIDNKLGHLKQKPNKERMNYFIFAAINRPI
jgi:hypothetical protein